MGQLVQQGPHLVVYHRVPIVGEIRCVVTKLRASPLGSRQPGSGTEEEWVEYYERMIGRIYNGTRHCSVFFVRHAASIHVGAIIRGIYLSRAIKTDERWRYSLAVDGGGGRSGSNIFYYASHKRGIAEVFKEGVEGSAGSWIVEIVKHSIEIGEKGL